MKKLTILLLFISSFVKAQEVDTLQFLVNLGFKSIENLAHSEKKLFTSKGFVYYTHDEFEKLQKAEKIYPCPIEYYTGYIPPKAAKDIVVNIERLEKEGLLKEFYIVERQYYNGVQSSYIQIVDKEVYEKIPDEYRLKVKESKILAGKHIYILKPLDINIKDPIVYIPVKYGFVQIAKW